MLWWHYDLRLIIQTNVQTNVQRPYLECLCSGIAFVCEVGVSLTHVQMGLLYNVIQMYSLLKCETHYYHHLTLS